MPRLVILAGALVALLALSLLAGEADHAAPQQVLVPLYGLEGSSDAQAVQQALSGIPGVSEVRLVETDVEDAAVLVSLKVGAGLRLSDVSRSLAEASEEMEGTCEIDGDSLRLVDGATIAVTGIEGEEQFQALLKDAVPGIDGAQVVKMESILTATLRVRPGTVVPFMKLVSAVEGQGGHVLDVMYQPAQMLEERPEQPSRPGPAPQGGGC